MKTHTFRTSGGYKRRYHIWSDMSLSGWCDLPDDDKTLTLYVDSNLQGLSHLETVVHEACHAINPTWSEARVTEHAREIARFVWRFGYRRSQDV